jgi:hypothetical protein
MTRRRLTPAQREEVLALRAHGHGLAWIAGHLGVGEGAVQWTCLAAGAEHPREIAKLRDYGDPAYVRNGRVVRPFTEHEDLLIVAMRRTGTQIKDIAAALKPPRGPSSISARLATIARRAARAEDGVA